MPDDGSASSSSAGSPGEADALVRRIVAVHLPAYRVERLVALGEGDDHRAHELNGELVVRVAKRPDAAAVRREAALLAAVAAVSPLPVPEAVFVDPDAGAIAYRRLPGAPLSQLSPQVGVVLAPALGALLAALHKLAPEGAPLDFDEPARWWRDAAECHERCAPPAAHRAGIERFLATPPPEPADVPVFSHNDLGAEHVLVDAGRVSAVIDWGDAARCDAAYDFGLLLRDLGPAGLDAALRGYGREPAGLRERAWFYARCSALEDLAALDGRRGRRALAHLFGD